jgi:hypothetical protein
MKIRTLLLVVAAMTAMLFQSCKSADERAVERLLNSHCSDCDWRVESFTDSTAYSIKDKCERLSKFNPIDKEDWHYIQEQFNACIHQYSNPYENICGTPKRLITAHCVSNSGMTIDFQVWQDGNGYYEFTDELTMYLDLDKELGKKYSEYQLKQSLYDYDYEYGF